MSSPKGLQISIEYFPVFQTLTVSFQSRLQQHSVETYMNFFLNANTRILSCSL